MTLRSEEKVIFDELGRLIATIEATNVRMTETIAKTRGLAPNDVLLCQSVQLPAAGGLFAWEIDFEVPYASVCVIPFSTNTTPYGFSSSPFPGDGAVYTGPGLVEGAQAQCICLPLVGTHFAIWSTAAAAFNVTVLAKPVAPWASRAN